MSYSLLKSRRVVARKAHQCVWCGHSILKNSHYERENSIYDGEFQNFAWHEACRKASYAAFDETHEEEFMPGDNQMPFFDLYKAEAALVSNAST
jgi:hypothetical protein